MAMCGRFETIGRGNVTVRVGDRGGMLQRSRSPINGDECRFETIGRGNVTVWVWGIGEGCYSVAEHLEMEMSVRMD